MENAIITHNNININTIQDQSGTISMEELKEVFGGDKITTEDWKEIIREVDENQDGEVNIWFIKFCLDLLLDPVWGVWKNDEEVFK